MDGGEHRHYRLRLTLGHGQQLVAVGVGDGFDGHGLTLGFQDLALPHPFRLQYAGALIAFGFGHHRSSLSLGLHLAVHRLRYVGGRLDPLDLHSYYAGTPLVGGVVEDLAQFGVDDLPGSEGGVEIQVPNHIPQVGLGELGNRHDEASHVVLELDRVRGLVVDDCVHRYHHVVLGDHLLGGNIYHLLPHVHLDDPLDEGHHPPESRIDGVLVATQ